MHVFWFIIITCLLSSAQENGTIRLMDGNATAGRVEIYLNDRWGTICNDFWDYRDATVVCHQLGFKETIRPFMGVSYGNGYGLIHLDDVGCYGYETSLTQCSYSTNHDCMHHEDVGIQCAMFGTRQQIAKVRVQTIKVGNVDIEPCVTVKNLGVYLDNHMSMDLHMDDSSLANLTLSTTIEPCRNVCTDDSTFQTSLANLTLSTTIEPCRNVCTGEVRLAGGNTTMGRVEVCLCESWGTVCTDEWSQEAAEVFCRQIGFKTFYSVRPRLNLDDSQGPRDIYKIKCFGNESQLLSCPYFQEGNCEHREDAIVSCVPYVWGDVRLAGGNQTAGRVEVFFDGQWGTICDDHWDIQDASVICHQLDFGDALHAFKNAHFGEGDGPIHVDTVECLGDESSLLKCEYKRHTDCRHHEDAGVSCYLLVDNEDKSEEQSTVVWLVIALLIFLVITFLGVALIFIKRYLNKITYDTVISKNSLHESDEFRLRPLGNVRPLPATPSVNLHDEYNVVFGDNLLNTEEATNGTDQSRCDEQTGCSDKDNCYNFLPCENDSYAIDNYVPMGGGNKDDNSLYSSSIGKY